jgi:hypothetical protein
MITAKVISKSENEPWLKHDLEYGKEYEVEDIDMGQSYTSVYIIGKPFPYNSVFFEFYEDGKPLDIYRDKRFNKYLFL